MSARIDEHADSLAEILAAQCADLETLLALAQSETRAVEDSDFDGLLRIVEARSQLGARLEVYSRQIGDLRSRLDAHYDAAPGGEMARTAVRLALAVQEQDGRTLPLLVRTREQAADESARLDRGRRNTSAYLIDARRAPVACDRRA